LTKALAMAEFIPLADLVIKAVFSLNVVFFWYLFEYILGNRMRIKHSVVILIF